MRTGVAFSDIVNEVKLEAGETTNATQATTRDPKIKQIINGVYRRLAQKHRWPLRHDEVEVTLVASTQTYTFPSTLSPAHIDEVWAQVGDQWYPIDHGVGRLQRSLYNDSEESWPPQRFEFQPDDGSGSFTFEVWPIPSQAGTVRVSGQLKITDLSADSDKCLIDADVVKWSAAAELLIDKNPPRAQLLLNRAEAHALDILRNMTTGIAPKIRHGRQPSHLRPGVDYIPAGWTDGYLG